MELERKYVTLSKQKGHAVSQVTLEEDLNVPDQKPDIFRIVHRQGEFCPDEIKGEAGKVKVRGIFHYRILYIGEGAGHMPELLEGSIPVDEVVFLNDLEEGDQVDFRWSQEDLHASAIHSRKANMKTILTLSVEAMKEQPVPLVEIPEAEELDIEPENIPLDIVYEDDDIIVINKPKGMVVHPAPGHTSGTLVNALMYHCKDSLSSINGVLRPGIVHRIDMDTTGLLVACKSDQAHRVLSDKFKVHDIHRVYTAIVYNQFATDEGTINKPIARHKTDRKKMAIDPNGRHAVTHYRVIERLKQNFSLVECELETGRTHQIRVHMASINHPLLGDEVYGPKQKPFATQGQVLHAGVLGFDHPITGEYMEWHADLPDYFQEILKRLR